MIETPVRRDEHATTTTRGGPPRYFALTLGPDGVLLAGTCERGIARSADGGHTWMAIDAGLDGAVVNAIVHHGDRWWAAAGEAGIVMSADGTRWERTPDLGGEVAFAVLTDTDGCIAGTDRGVRVRRSDRWEQIDPGPTSAVYRLVRAASGAVVAATEADGVWVGDGAGWRPAAPIEWPVFALDLDEDTWLAGTRGAGVLRSVDGGTSWKPANDGLPDLVVHAFARDDAGRIFAGTGLGVASSADEGRSWQPLGGDLSGHRIFSVTIDRRGRVLAGSYEGVWRSDPTWQQWEALDTGLGAQESFAVTSGSDGRAWLGRRAGVDVSDDGGRTWRRGPDDDAAGTTLSLLVEDRSPDGARVLAGTDGGVRRLLDGGWACAGLDGMRVRSLVAGEAGALLAGTLGHGIQRR
ncbi:MAG: WD40/YVTN/BNR-like repeat-containing protein, partial [Ilumatobacteraceae bacterium]